MCKHNLFKTPKEKQVCLCKYGTIVVSITTRVIVIFHYNVVARLSVEGMERNHGGLTK